jgi:hypothetical protein
MDHAVGEHQQGKADVNEADDHGGAGGTRGTDGAE